MKKLVPLTLVFFLALASCNRHESRLANASPEDIVREFVMLSASSKGLSDKKTLQELCSGEMNSAFDKMTDEVFRISYLNTNLKVRDLKILDTSTQGETARVHYQVVVDNPHGTDPTLETNEREVDLARQQGRWYIESIRGKGSDQIAFSRGMIF
jgi:hypothetical protein